MKLKEVELLQQMSLKELSKLINNNEVIRMIHLLNEEPQHLVESIFSQYFVPLHQPKSKNLFSY